MFSGGRTDRPQTTPPSFVDAAQAQPRDRHISTNGIQRPPTGDSSTIATATVRPPCTSTCSSTAWTRAASSNPGHDLRDVKAARSPGQLCAAAEPDKSAWWPRWNATQRARARRGRPPRRNGRVQPVRHFSRSPTPAGMCSSGPLTRLTSSDRIACITAPLRMVQAR